MTSAGDRDAANEIRYLGRVRERKTEHGWSYIWSGLSASLAGTSSGSDGKANRWFKGNSIENPFSLWTTQMLWRTARKAAGAMLVMGGYPAPRENHQFKFPS